VEMEWSTRFAEVRRSRGRGRRACSGPGATRIHGRRRCGQEELGDDAVARIAAYFGQTKLSEGAPEQGEERETKNRRRCHLDLPESAKNSGKSVELR
jgi:hypothetical protein